MWKLRSLSKIENELYQRVDEVLHYVWDPIGVCGVPEARDEYYSYLPTVFGLVNRGATEDEVATHLGKITSSSMGMGINRSRDLEVAEILINWKESLLDDNN